MTSNDEFDQEQFDDGDFHDEGLRAQESPKSGLIAAWRSKPLFKLVIIMAGVGVALVLALGVFSEDKAPPISSLAKAPSIREAPGGAASPFFIEQNKQANSDRAHEALSQGGSALPTPAGHDVTDLVDKNKKDPLTEFREETERLKRELRSEQQQNNQKLQVMQQQVAQGVRQTPAQDDTLARAMQKQMQQMMDSWAPHGGKVVPGYAKEDPVEAASSPSAGNLQQALAQQQATSARADTVLVPSGTVNYAQLLMEANSDIPGPILAQILSGPLAGGRAIGRFEVKNDFLVMSFNLVNLKGKEYAINALALDPDTTLGGLATEVNHRYFSRILLPAAGEFISAFGQALSETDVSTTVADGAVLQDQAKKGAKEALYSGLGKAGDTMSEFFKNEANKIQTLVRVAVGTPM
ncbi:MAG: hypothetical protein PHD48_08715, partial [Alphaproteobacteria bacterium]|nr:hypothetical protein [Alphaproteobacteria bacterium]